MTLLTKAALFGATIAASWAAAPAQAGPAASAHLLVPSVVHQVAERAPARRADTAGDAAVARLNDESLRRAREGVGSPSPGPDTTQNLNRGSQENAQGGRNSTGAPMPFR